MLVIQAKDLLHFFAHTLLTQARAAEMVQFEVQSPAMENICQNRKCTSSFLTTPTITYR